MTTILNTTCSKIKRAVIYCRVSTDEQAKGYSLPTQLEACRQYAESHGFEVVASFKDDYSGATPIELRPEGRKAYEMLARGEADALIVYRVDRLVRPPEDGDEWDIPILIRGLAKVGREIHTIDRGKLETSFAGLLIAVLDGKSAGDERRKIMERSIRGRKAKANEKWVGSGYAPYGYAKVGKGKHTEIVICETEAKNVRRIFNLYLGLNGAPRLSTSRIAELFHTEKIPVTGRGAPNKMGWHSSTIQRIITNRACVGEFRYAGQMLSLPDKAIIDRDVFDAAQAQRATNHEKSKRNARYDYLMRGQVTCACGLKSQGAHTPYRDRHYLYYVCQRRSHDKHLRHCTENPVRADIVDGIVWDWLVSLLRNPDKMREGLTEYAARQRAQTEPNRQRLAEVIGLIADTEKQAARLATSIQNLSGDDKRKDGDTKRKDDDDDLAVSSLEAQLKQVGAAHKRYKAERARLTAELDADETNAVQQDQVMGLIAEINQGIADGDVSFTAKRALVERLHVTAKIEYQNTVRGLRLTCVIANDWRALSDVNLLSARTGRNQQIVLSAWLPLDNSLAAQWLATAGITAQVVTA